METVKTCRDCGNEFTLTEDDVAYFTRTITDKKPGSPTYGQEIQLKLPSRCQDCLDKKRAKQSQN